MRRGLDDLLGHTLQQVSVVVCRDPPLWNFKGLLTEFYQTVKVRMRENLDGEKYTYASM